MKKVVDWVMTAAAQNTRGSELKEHHRQVESLTQNGSIFTPYTGRIYPP